MDGMQWTKNCDMAKRSVHISQCPRGQTLIRALKYLERTGFSAAFQKINPMPLTHCSRCVCPRVVVSQHLQASMPCLQFSTLGRPKTMWHSHVKENNIYDVTNLWMISSLSLLSDHHFYPQSASFLNLGYAHTMHCDRIFHSKPSILGFSYGFPMVFLWFSYVLGYPPGQETYGNPQRRWPHLVPPWPACSEPRAAGYTWRIASPAASAQEQRFARPPTAAVITSLAA